MSRPLGKKQLRCWTQVLQRVGAGEAGEGRGEPSRSHAEPGRWFHQDADPKRGAGGRVQARLQERTQGSGPSPGALTGRA